MFFLIAVILLNVALSAIFKLFPRYGIDALQAIVVNYYVCVLTGSLYLGAIPYTQDCFHTAWFPWTFLMGLGFITLFNLIAWCTRVDGITTAAVANKLSLVIPVMFSVILMGEKAGIWKLGGIFLAFPAIYLTTRTPDAKSGLKNLWLPACLFIGSGLLDTGMNFIQQNFLTAPGDPDHYTIFCFSIAGIIGSIVLGLRAMTGRTSLQSKNAIAGILVGIPNYFSIYYFVRMLHSHFMESSASIPVLNIGIVVASALTAVLLYREKLSLARIAGLILSLLSIVMIALGRG